jgi:hypothetical protein
MSPQQRDLLHTLRNTLCKIDADPSPSPALVELRHILIERIGKMEAASILFREPLHPRRHPE